MPMRRRFWLYGLIPLGILILAGIGLLVRPDFRSPELTQSPGGTSSPNVPDGVVFLVTPATQAPLFNPPPPTPTGTPTPEPSETPPPEPASSPVPTAEPTADSQGQEYTQYLPSICCLGGSLDSQPSFPLRLVFYYPWFPESWDQHGVRPYTRYNPALGFYDSSNRKVIREHIEAMLYGKIDGGILSWWGQNHPTDQRVPAILQETTGSIFRWSFYHEGESQADPPVGQINSDLVYLQAQYGSHPGLLRITSRMVVFVHGDSLDSCSMIDRWKQANTVNAYLVVSVFPGFRSCSNQPDAWHQIAPTDADGVMIGDSFSISPGFWEPNQPPRLERRLDRWNEQIRLMQSSEARFQLITTFNDWGEGTAIEAAADWAGPSKYGLFLDALHDDGKEPNAATLVGAGDISLCEGGDDALTAGLLANIPGTIFTAGDNTNDSGTADQYNLCFNRTWGQFKDRLRPSMGNHDALTNAGAAYYQYFGSSIAGPAGKGYYSYELGEWHIVVLNSQCDIGGGCGSDSEQTRWLKADLAAHPSRCTLAYWHVPQWSSGIHGGTNWFGAFWQALYDVGAELVINGHDHHYERFAPQNPAGQADPQAGIRQFIAGTGGAGLRLLGETQPNSEVRITGVYGVLKLTLHPDRYDWEFVPVNENNPGDHGTTLCH